MFSKKANNITTFNRTIIELKREVRPAVKNLHSTFNRTIIELKLKNELRLDVERTLLIGLS